MSDWKVSREEIQILPHFNADTLELAKVGSYQVVVKKGEFEMGDTIVFIPEKSVLPDEIAEGFKSYLIGPEKNRVRSVRLRGEYSCGIILPADDFESFPLGQDISAELGIIKYEPPVPTNMAGDIDNIHDDEITRHDCDHFGVYQEEFVVGEPVIVSEKIHGSQFAMYRNQEGEFFVSSKGLMKQNLALRESVKNLYWRAAHNMNLFETVNLLFETGLSVQCFGEVVPCQKKYDYGQANPRIVFFDVIVDGQSIPFDQLPEYFCQNWVPILYNGPFDASSIRELAKGMEQLSGSELHIREGVVVRPKEIRMTEDGKRLFLKILNPKYTETGEEFD